VESELLNVFVNGEPRQVPSDSTVASLLEWLKLPSERVAVELNKSIVRKRHWRQTPVARGAQLEIVEFVGGG
jgi:sulfur carrier protein